MFETSFPTAASFGSSSELELTELKIYWAKSPWATPKNLLISSSKVQITARFEHYFNFRGSENSVVPPYFQVGKQPFNSTVLVMCGKWLCIGVENKLVQARNTKSLSFSLLNSLPEWKVKITYCSGCVFVFCSFFPAWAYW